MLGRAAERLGDSNPTPHGCEDDLLARMTAVWLRYTTATILQSCAVFRERPPLPIYKKTYDITPVLDFIASLGPLEDLKLKDLTYKTMFLLSFTTLSRVSSLVRLKCEFQETQMII